MTLFELDLELLKRRGKRTDIGTRRRSRGQQRQPDRAGDAACRGLCAQHNHVAPHIATRASTHGPGPEDEAPAPLAQAGLSAGRDAQGSGNTSRPIFGDSTDWQHRLAVGLSIYHFARGSTSTGLDFAPLSDPEAGRARRITPKYTASLPGLRLAHAVGFPTRAIRAPFPPAVAPTPVSGSSVAAPADGRRGRLPRVDRAIVVKYSSRFRASAHHAAAIELSTPRSSRRVSRFAGRRDHSETQYGDRIFSSSAPATRLSITAPGEENRRRREHRSPRSKESRATAASSWPRSGRHSMGG